MTTRKRIAGLGELLWDMYPDERFMGGAPANVALHANRLGAEGLVISRVGADDLGEALIREAEKSGVNTACIQRDTDKPTGTVRVTLNKDKIPRFDCSKDTAFDYLSWNDALQTLSGQVDAVVVGTLAQRNLVSRHTIHRFLEKTRGVVLFDVNFRSWNAATEIILLETLALTDILKLNSDELNPIRTGIGNHARNPVAFMEWMIGRFGLKLVALTLGNRGCLLTDGKQRVLSPGYKVEAVDTTGCGDGFTAGLLFNYLNGRSLDETAEFANLMGAYLATRKGAAPVYAPDDLDRFREIHRERYEINLPNRESS